MSDLARGVAYRRGTRLICAACDRAMGGGGPQVAGTSARASSGGLIFGALWVALFAMGLAGWALWQLQAVRTKQGLAERDLVAQGEQLERRLERWQNQVQSERQQALETWDQGTRARASELEERISEELAQWTVRLEQLEQASRASEDSIQSQSITKAQHLDRLEATQQALGELLGKLEQEWNATQKTWVASQEALGGRIDSLELEWAALQVPEQGVEAAAWFPITQELLHDLASARLQAMYSLEQSHDPRICPFLAPLLVDSDPLVRIACARILREHSYRPIVGVLIEGLEDPALSVRVAFLEALRSITGRQFGFRADGRDSERRRPLQDWRDWWKAHGEAFVAGEAS